MERIGTEVIDIWMSTEAGERNCDKRIYFLRVWAVCDTEIRRLSSKASFRPSLLPSKLLWTILPPILQKVDLRKEVEQGIDKEKRWQAKRGKRKFTPITFSYFLSPFPFPSPSLLLPLPWKFQRFGCRDACGTFTLHNYRWQSGAGVQVCWARCPRA